MREIRFTRTFLRHWSALQRAKSVGFDDLDTVVYMLGKGDSLPLEFDDHALTDDYEGFREFHLSGDVVVIYKASARRVTLMDVGGHAAMFGHRKRKRKGTAHRKSAFDEAIDQAMSTAARTLKRMWHSRWK